MPVGNPAPDFYREVRPGTDLYADSVGALDVKTGKLLWYDKFVAIDMHDWDLSQVSPIFRAPAKGKERNLLTVTGKDGFLRMIDRDSRELLYEMPITTRENADAEPTVSGVHICPGLLGGVEWSGPALDPKSNTLFVVSVDWCGIFKRHGGLGRWRGDQLRARRQAICRHHIRCHLRVLRRQRHLGRYYFRAALAAFASAAQSEGVL